MKGEKGLQIKLQRAFRDRMPCKTDEKGYVRYPADNLVEGVYLEQFEADLREGAGEELRMKFCACHSSAALAVNCFAWFKHPDRLPYLTLLGSQGANDLRFESRLPIFRGGTPPNIDVWIERDGEIIAIESKLTEYLLEKQAKFSKAYDRLTPPGQSELCWWTVYQQAKKGKPQHLDIAQLVKHYLGLWTYKQKMKPPKPVHFLYIFWEPQDWEKIEVCRQHRQECAELAQATEESHIPFQWLTYRDLWQQWLKVPALAQHAKDLIARYDVSVT